MQTDNIKSQWLRRNFHRYVQVHPKSGVQHIDFPSLVDALDKVLQAEEDYAESLLEAVRKLKAKYTSVNVPPTD